MSTTYEIRPNDQLTTDNGFGSHWTYSDAGYNDGAPDLADDDDNTSWYNGSGDTELIEMAFGTFSLPAGANIISVTVTVRWRGIGPSASTTEIKDKVGGTSRAVGTLSGVGWDNPALGNQVMTAETTNPSGGAWSQSDIDDFRVTFQLTSGPGVQIYEIWADVVTSEPPSATVFTPTGTQTSTNQPTVTWSYSDPDGDAQTNFWVKIFSDAEYNGGGFDPDVTAAIWDSGDTAGADTSKQVGIALNSGVTYKAYVKVSDSLSGYGDWAAGPEFDIAASGRDTPGRVFFAHTEGAASTVGGYYAFDDSDREGSFTFKTAPLRDPSGRSVEIREVQVYARSYDANATVAITVNGTTKTQTISSPGRQQLTFLFRERGETLDVQLVSTAGAPSANEAPTIETVRIGWRPLHTLR